MPTVLRVGGLRIVVYPNDHRPAHVHVIGSDSEAVFQLRCPQGPIVLRENYGFGRLEIGRIQRALQRAHSRQCREWEKIHGAE